MDRCGTSTSKFKLCFRVGYPGGEVQPIPEGDSSPIPECTHWGGLAMHRMASILCLFLAANLIAAGQEASSKAAVGQSARTAASPSIASPLTSKLIESLQATVNDPGGDYFIASREEQKNIVSGFGRSRLENGTRLRKVSLRRNFAVRAGAIA